MAAIIFLQLLIFLIGFLFLGFFPIQKNALNFFDFWTLGALLLAGLSSGFYLFKRRKELLDFPPMILLFVFSGGILRYLCLNLYSIWLDEETQFLGPSRSGVILSSTTEQQMPLDYLFSGISHMLFGTQEFAPRLFPLIFGALACGVFVIWAKRFISNQWILILSGLFFATSPWLIRFSVEGRPLSLAILSGLVFLTVFDKFFSGDNYKKTECQLAMGGSTFLLLGATFFQNYIFLASANLAYFVLKRPAREKAIKVLIPQLAALFLWAPVLWKLVDYSFRLKTNKLDIATIFSSNNKHYTFWDVFESTWITQAEVLLIGVPFLITTTIMIFRGKPLHPGQKLCLLLGVFFIGIFSSAYFTLVNWEIYSRYSIMLTPVIFLLVFSSIDQVRHLFQKRTAMAVVTIAGMGAVSLNFHDFLKYHSENLELAKHSDWRGLYKALRTYGKPGDIVLGARYDTYSDWIATGLFGNRFYLKGNEGFLLNEMNGTFPSQVSYLRHLLQRGDAVRPKAVFLIHIWNGGYNSPKLPSDLFLMGFKQSGLMGKQVKDQTWPETLLRLIRVSRDMKSDGAALTFLQMEMEILRHLNRPEGSRSILNELERLGMSYKEPELFAEYAEFVNSATGE